MIYDRLTCIMAVADKYGYGPHYGTLVANTTEAQRDKMEGEGRMMLQRRAEIRRKFREKHERKKGEGQWKSDPARKKTT